ncbi:hypothetical protein ACKJUJ_001102 [Cronobacter sakazakii]
MGFDGSLRVACSRPDFIQFVAVGLDMPSMAQASSSVRLYCSIRLSPGVKKLPSGGVCRLHFFTDYLVEVMAVRFMTRRLLFNHRISILFALKNGNHSVTSAIPAYLVNNMNSLILGSHIRSNKKTRTRRVMVLTQTHRPTAGMSASFHAT